MAPAQTVGRQDTVVLINGFFDNYAIALTAPAPSFTPRMVRPLAAPVWFF